MGMRGRNGHSTISSWQGSRVDADHQRAREVRERDRGLTDRHPLLYKASELATRKPTEEEKLTVRGQGFSLKREALA